MNEFNIYFSDLTPDCQERLLNAFWLESPSEMNWDGDILPITTLFHWCDGENYGTSKG